VTRYLLDTNVVSELRKKTPHGAVLAWMQIIQTEQIFLSVITAGELQGGVEKTRRQDAAKAQEIEDWLGNVLASFAFLSMDAACFREWARLIANLPVSLKDDAMIAATARVHGLTVATRNEKDFKRLEVEIFNPFKFKAPFKFKIP
jgi:predicted nucleic acid-binding protein